MQVTPHERPVDPDEWVGVEDGCPQLLGGNVQVVPVRPHDKPHHIDLR